MPQKTVRVVLRGGLGNQLFQYGAGLALSRRNNARLLIDTSILPGESVTINGVTRWPSQLGEFNHGGVLVNGTKSSQVTRRFHSSVLHVERQVGDLAPKLMRKFGRFSNEKHGEFDHFYELAGNRIVVNSYCNSPRYFLEYGDEIRETVRSLRHPSSEFSNMASLAKETQPLALHVRLGDYKNLAKIYGRVDPRYFSSSLDLQMQLNGERDIWLFSDEPALAFDLLRDSKHKIIVPPDLQKLSGLETVLTMASCSGLVASNSSFSWWAAYLNQDMNARVIFPRPFFALGGPSEPKDWLLENWIQLGRTI